MIANWTNEFTYRQIESAYKENRTSVERELAQGLLAVKKIVVQNLTGLLQSITDGVPESINSRITEVEASGADKMHCWKQDIEKNIDVIKCDERKIKQSVIERNLKN